MRFFDLHCDTAGECEESGESLYSNSMALSLKTGEEKIEKWVQTFALFIHDKFSPLEQRERFERKSAYLDAQIAENSLELFKGKMPQNGCAVIKSIENASFIGDDLEYIGQLAAQGFRVASLSWNAANVYAGGADSNEGLSELGLRAAKEFERNSITIDVSHLCDASLSKLLERFSGTVIATHSNARKICAHRRNLPDDMLKEIAARGGIIGLNFFTLFLADSEPGINDILRHAEHIMNVCGENAVAIGSDFDGAQMPDGLKYIGDVEKLYQLMIQYFGKAVAEKVFFTNAFEYFREKFKTNK